MRKLIVTAWVALALCYGCTSHQNTSSNSPDSGATKLASDSDGNAAPRDPDGTTLIRGTVINASSKKIILKTKDSTQTVILSDSLHLYGVFQSSLAELKNTSFIGVTTQKQADGSDRATEIHIFPEEMRGMREGSFMMDGQTGTGNRMTNGAESRMTNGSASRMTNGAIQKTDGSSLVIQYQGKSRTVLVPAGTPVTAYKATNKKLSPGDQVVALAKKDASGNYIIAKIMIHGK